MRGDAARSMSACGLFVVKDQSGVQTGAKIEAGVVEFRVHRVCPPAKPPDWTSVVTLNSPSQAAKQNPRSQVPWQRTAHALQFSPIVLKIGFAAVREDAVAIGEAEAADQRAGVVDACRAGVGVGEAAQETPVALAAMLGIDQTRPNRLTHAQPAPAALAVVVAWRDASMRVRSRSARMVLPNPDE